MIISHGIDLQEIGAIRRAHGKDNRPAKRMLMGKELQCSSKQKSTKRQMEFLAGHWAAKGALTKAMGIGIGILGFKDIEILNNQSGAPVIIRPPLSGKYLISLSHTGDLAQASVILEDNS